MSYIGNFNRLCQNPQRHLCAASKEAEVAFGGTSLNCKKSQSALFGKFSAQPSAHYPPYTWVMPRTAGRICSRNLTEISIIGAGSLAQGMAITGSAAISLDSSATGSLAIFGSGTAIIAISSSADISGAIYGSGEAIMSIDSSATMEAYGWLSGEATIQVDGSADIYGLGWLTGTTEETGALTPAAIAAAVWDLALTGHTGAGTTGQALSAAGSAGDPWITTLPGSYTGAQAGALLAALQDLAEAISAKTDNLPASPASEATLTLVAELVEELHRIKGLNAAVPVATTEPSETVTVLTAGDITLTIDDNAGITRT
jgi:hypothetical protein